MIQEKEISHLSVSLPLDISLRFLVHSFMDGREAAPDDVNESTMSWLIGYSSNVAISTLSLCVCVYESIHRPRRC